MERDFINPSISGRIHFYGSKKRAPPSVTPFLSSLQLNKRFALSIHPSPSTLLPPSISASNKMALRDDEILKRREKLKYIYVCVCVCCVYRGVTLGFFTLLIIALWHTGDAHLQSYLFRLLCSLESQFKRKKRKRKKETFNLLFSLSLSQHNKHKRVASFFLLFLSFPFLSRLLSSGPKFVFSL